VAKAPGVEHQKKTKSLEGLDSKDNLAESKVLKALAVVPKRQNGVAV